MLKHPSFLLKFIHTYHTSVFKGLHNASFYSQGKYTSMQGLENSILGNIIVFN